MPLETGDFITDLVVTNPLGTDPKAEGDDHLRLLKRTVQQSWPGINAAVRMTSGHFNALTGIIGAFPIAVAEGAATGWLRCNGQAVLRATYPDLFAFLGLAYGPGNGTTDFVLPDYRGKFLRDQDEGAAIDGDAATRTDRGDGTTGDAPGTQQDSQNLSHQHPSAGSHTHNSISNHTHSLASPTTLSGGVTNAKGNGTGGTLSTTGSAGGHTHTADGDHQHDADGGADARPINVYVKHYIHV